MIQNEIAQKYSLALFELAKSQNKLLDYKSELEVVLDVFKSYRDLRRFFYHPRVLPEDKKKVIMEVFSTEVSPHIGNFLKLLVDKRREFYLELIIKEFIKMVNDAEDILEVEVISAVALSDKLKNKLKSRLDKILDNKIIIDEKVDPSIIGGLVLKIGDRVIDGSIKHDLDSLREKVTQIPVSELGV